MNRKTIGIIVLALVVIGITGYFVLGTDKDALVNDSQPSLTRKTSSPDTDTTDTSETILSNYQPFDTSQFEKAKSDGKVTMLYFTANWCPTCKAQEPVNTEAFKELEGDEDIVIFEAHILDSETTEVTEDLAKEYGVRLQHTFVIINPAGEVVFTHTGPLTKEDIVEELQKAKS